MPLMNAVQVAAPGAGLEAGTREIPAPGGREVLITKDTHLKAALLNRSGTRIVASA